MAFIHTNPKIASAVWDCTIGSGCGAEAPTADDLEYIEDMVGRSLTPEDLEVITREWKHCLQCLGQP